MLKQFSKRKFNLTLAYVFFVAFFSHVAIQFLCPDIGVSKGNIFRCGYNPPLSNLPETHRFSWTNTISLFSVCVAGKQTWWRHLYMQGERMFNYPCILQCLYILINYYDFKLFAVLVKVKMTECSIWWNRNFSITSTSLLLRTILHSLHQYYKKEKYLLHTVYGYGKNKKRYLYGYQWEYSLNRTVSIEWISYQMKGILYC